MYHKCTRRLSRLETRVFCHSTGTYRVLLCVRRLTLYIQYSSNVHCYVQGLGVSSNWANGWTDPLLFFGPEKKVINFQKWPKWRFWRLVTFFWFVFKNTEQNNNCVFIVFKAESEPKHKEKFFGGKNKIVLKLKFKICISAFVLYCKRKLHAN